MNLDELVQNAPKRGGKRSIVIPINNDLFNNVIASIAKQSRLLILKMDCRVAKLKR